MHLVTANALIRHLYSASACASNTGSAGTEPARDGCRRVGEQALSKSVARAMPRAQDPERTS
jgi:Rod binding domain-containing protein